MSSGRLMGALAAVTLAVAVLPQIDAAGREQCASSLITSLYLTGHHPKGPFYVATKSQGGSFTVLREGDNCTDGEWTDAYYSLRPETTSAGDLSPSSGKARLYAPTDGSHPGGNERTVDVDVVGEIEGVEKAILRIDESEHSGQDSPVYYNRAAPFYVVDTDSPSSVVVGEPDLRVNEALTARIPVFRTGPISGDKTVSFSVVPGTALPGADYEEPSSNTVTFSSGSRVEVISIRTLQDGFKEGDEGFSVELEGDDVASPSSTTVTINDMTARDLRPTGRLHHPKNNYKYPRNYPWVNEIHIFTRSADEEDFRVDKAQLALRKRWKGGGCGWWKGDGFARGKCDEVRWFGKGIKNPGRNYFKYNIRKKLALSVGKKSNVRNYKIWGRWYDDEGRMSISKKNRSMNRFEVIPPCKGNPFNFKKCKPTKP